MKKQEIQMDQFGVTTDANLNLTTEGISTCIAFIANGYYFDKNRKAINFGALFHWSGFGASERDPKGKTQVVFIEFIDKIREKLNLSSTHPIAINLAFIGGERKQVNEHGKLIVSGTEAEVKALSHILNKMSFEKHALYLASSIQQHHYKTSETDSLKINVGTTQYSYEMEQPEQHIPQTLGMRF
jgi:hypothetical protein